MNTVRGSTENHHVKIYEVNGILIDLQLKEIAYDGSIHRPTTDVFTTLIYLIENRERVITVEELRRWLWGNRDASEFEILRSIMKARQALMDDTSKEIISYNTEEKGYQFVGELLELEIQ